MFFRIKRNLLIRIVTFILLMVALSRFILLRLIRCAIIHKTFVLYDGKQWLYGEFSISLLHMNIPLNTISTLENKMACIVFHSRKNPRRLNYTNTDVLKCISKKLLFICITGESKFISKIDRMN